MEEGFRQLSGIPHDVMQAPLLWTMPDPSPAPPQGHLRGGKYVKLPGVYSLYILV